MAFLEYDLTIPAGTAEDEPATRSIRPGVGYVDRVEVMIPPGAAGLAFTKCDRGEHTVWPANPGGAIKGDGIVVGFTDSYDLTDAPGELLLIGWSPSARFAHTLTWRIHMLAADVAEATLAAPSLLQRIARVLVGS